MPTEDELWSTLREAYALPYGSGQIALVEQVISHADAGGLDELRFAARMLATTAYVYGGEPAKSFVTFSWCLAEYDRHPERHDRSDESNLLWHFKYMITGLTKFPEVPLARTYDVLDDMQRRYLAGGHSLHAVYSHRWVVAEHIGDRAAADEWYEKWCAAPRDDNSDCVGCDPTSKVEHLTARGLDEEAVALAAPVLGGRLTCSEQPQMILTELLLPYVRTGRLAEAADAHRRGYRLIRGKLADLSEIATHVVFLARTGNEVRGLEIVERHLDWLDRAPSPHAEMEFAAASALLLSNLAKAGRGELPVRRRGAATPVGDLADELARRATDIAARFDRRNGTGAVGDRIAGLLSAEPLVEALPLSAVDRAVSRRPAPRQVARASVSLPDDPSAILDAAEQAARLRYLDRLEAALSRFDERCPEPPPALVARRLDCEGLRLATVQRYGDAAETWVRAAQQHAAAGEGVRALIAEARRVSLPAQDMTMSTGLDELAGLTERIVAVGEPEQRAGALIRLASCQTLHGLLDEALASCERAIALLDEDMVLSLAEAGTRLSHVLHLKERYEDSAARAAQARARYGQFGEPPAMAITCLVQADALARLDRVDEAADAFSVVIRCGADAAMVTAARAGRGRLLAAAGRSVEAIDDLVEAVAGFVAVEDDLEAAQARLDLAVTYYEAGQLLDAAESGESAVDVLDRHEAQESADRARYVLSKVYRDLADGSGDGWGTEAERALDLLDQLTVNLDGYDNLPSRGQMYEEAGQLLYGADRDGQAAERFAGAVGAYNAAELPFDELRARRWYALSLRWAGESDRALEAVDAADALAATLPAEEPMVGWEIAMLGFDAARVYIGADRPESALDRAADAAAGFRAVEAWDEAMQADLLRGELLLRLGRAEEAEPVLRLVLGGASHESPAREQAVWLLAEVLDELGRPDEAEALRTNEEDR